MATSLEARLTKKVPFVLRDANPTTMDYHFDPPHLWLNRETDKIFLLADVTEEVATWIEVAGGVAGGVAFQKIAVLGTL